MAKNPTVFPPDRPANSWCARLFVLVLAIGLLAPRPAPAQAPVPEKPDKSRLRLLVEPRFQSPPVWELFPGAKETGVAAGILTKDGTPRFLTTEEMKILATDLTTLRKDALVHVEKLLAATQPRRVLAPDQKSSTHCIYHGKSPLMASLILTPKLHERHTEEYGPTLLAVVPDRFTVVLLPADPEILEGRSDLLTSIFDQSVYPVSLEVFQIDASGVRVIGNLSAP